MAYAIDSSTYANTDLNDTFSGSPDYWTNYSGGSHSYGSSQLTFTKPGTAACSYRNVALTAHQLYIRCKWKRTADNASTPTIVLFGDNAGNNSVGIYQNMSTNRIFARNGAGWTDTGHDLASKTSEELEFVVDRDAGTYKLYCGGSLIGTYNIDTNTDAAFSYCIMFNGTTAATCTAVFSDAFLIKNTIITTNIKTWNGLANASIKTVIGLARASVKTINGLASILGDLFTPMRRTIMLACIRLSPLYS